MNKRLIIICIALLMSLGLSSCKSSDYKEADSLYRSEKYLEAAKIYSTLGDYKDSKERLKKCIDKRVDPILEDTMRINKYADAIEALDSFNEITDCSKRIANLMDDCVDEYLIWREYDKAISVMEEHSTIADYSKRIEEVKQKKEYFKVYEQAISLFEQGKYDEGFEVLKAVPDDFECVHWLKSSYEGFESCPFNGKHIYRQGPNEPYMTVSFNPTFQRLGENQEYFALQIHKVIYWSDGDIFEEHKFYPSIDKIEDNSISTGEYTWTIDKYGKLMEQQKGNVYVYDD